MTRMAVWRDMGSFLTMWAGQLVSLFGTGMTQFAMTIWAWDLTGRATALALVGFFTFASTVALSPFAGALVDRHDRKVILIASDGAAGLATAILLILHSTGNLEMWHLYATGLIAGASQAFQYPAYWASVTLLVSTDNVARASGLASLAESAARILAPAMAGALLGFIGIGGILLVDLATFAMAMVTLAMITIPAPDMVDDALGEKGSLWRDSVYGFRYIWDRRSLLFLTAISFAANLSLVTIVTLVAPMILTRTGNDQIALATVQSVGAIGSFVGGLLLSVWGGPQRRMVGVLGSTFFIALFGYVPLGVGRRVLVWAVGYFAVLLFVAFYNGSIRAIWNAKVAPGLQGRVFAARRLIGQSTIPLSMLLAGTVADRVFEPAMADGGALQRVFGNVIGTGAGAGMATMIFLAGVTGIAVSLGSVAVPALRNIERRLPDYHAAPPSPSEGGVGEDGDSSKGERMSDATA